MKMLRHAALILLTLSFSAHSGIFDTPKRSITAEQLKQLLYLSTYNFACGYYGRYSNKMDSPLLYHSYIDRGQEIIKILKRTEGFSKKQLRALDEIEERMKKAVIQDLNKHEDSIKDMLTALSQEDILYKPTNCSQVRSFTNRVIDSLD